MSSTPLPLRLHHLTIKYIIQNGRTPGVARLSAQADCSKEDVISGLRQLEAMRGVILKPGTADIWALHPFSLMPTVFWVSTANEGGWWANCAWCSLGIGTVLNAEVRVSTRDGGDGAPLEFRLPRTMANLPDVMVHFPTRPSQWWDNPYNPCGNIMFFTSEEKLDEWCRRHGIPKGSLLKIEKAIALANLWFEDYASALWRRKTAQEVTEIFTKMELDPAFWTLEGGWK